MLRFRTALKDLISLSGVLHSGPTLSARGVLSRAPDEWQWLRDRGVQLNPCNSPLHPAVLAGAVEVLQGQQELSIQEAYTPHSTCFGCGPASSSRLQLRSFRSNNGLTASVSFDPRFQAFPGIVHGGAISALFECHGNWTAAVTLMDRGRLSKPPLTLTKEILVQYLEPTPPTEDLLLISTVTHVEEYKENPSRRDSVQVDLQLCKVVPGHQEQIFATSTGRFKKVGALRAM